MTNLFGSEEPAEQDLTGGPYQLATRFIPSIPGKVTQARWFIPTVSMTGSLRFLLWQDTTVVLDQSFAVPTSGLGTWQEFTFTTPHVVTVDALYTIGVITPDALPRQYSYAWPKTSGGLTTPDPAGYLNYDGAPTYPTDTFSSVNFFADVTFIPSPTIKVWNGTAEVDATLTVWNGSTEVAASVDSIV